MNVPNTNELYAWNYPFYNDNFKISQNQVQQYMKIMYHDQVWFNQEMQSLYNMRNYINRG